MMILQGPTSPTFTDGVDFKCDPTTGSMAGKQICYGIGTVHNEFVAFQKLLNTLAVKYNLGFSLTPDGFIGKNTVDATVRVLRVFNLSGTPASAAASEVTSNPDRRIVARWVPILTQYLSGNPAPAASVPQLTTPPAPGAPAAQPGPSSPAPGMSPSPAGFGPPVAATPWWWWVAGGVAVIGAVMVGVVIYRRRKH